MMAHLRYKFLVFCLHLFANTLAADRICIRGVDSHGYTEPRGDITLLDGGELNITCVLNENAIRKYGPNASEKMYFVLNNHKVSSEIVNASAIRYYIKSHPKTHNSDYVCEIDGEIVCHNIVTVGIPPQNVTDFSCMGRNFKNFTCNFTPPENYVYTRYSLSYYPDNIRYKHRNRFMPARNTTTSNKKAKTEKNKQRCPIEGLTRTKGKLSCFWSITTSPIYRHSWAEFIFRLTASNRFGNNTQEFRINNFENTRPDPPLDLTGIPIGPHEIKIQWDLAYQLKARDNKLVFRISWCGEHYKNWTTEEKIINGTPPLSYTLRNLPYAHWLYEIKVSSKVLEATEARFWSDASIIFVRTFSKIPDGPPKTVEGSFEYLNPTRSRFVCWQRLERNQENGNDTSYYLEATSNDGNFNDVDLIKPQTARDVNCFKYEHLPDRNYTFKIWTKNEQGRSNYYSKVFSPSLTYALKPVASFLKYEISDGVYSLWWRGSDDKRVSSYTLFWCSSQKERPLPCDGTLRWKKYSPEINNVTLELNTYDYDKNQSINMYHFAISANGAESSSGMLWADCSYIPNNAVKFQQLYVKDATARSLTIYWELDKCVKLDDVLSFNVSYCPCSEDETTCLPGTLKYAEINGKPEKNQGRFDIVGLKPYTTYIIRVQPVIQDTESQFSKAMFNHTLADYPTVPLNLNVDVAEKELTVKWDKPQEENGHMSSYNIKVFGLDPIKKTAEKEKLHYEMKINNILPRTQYNISVEACNEKFCSNGAKTSVQTPIGDPGQVALPSWNFNNVTKMAWLNWEKPGPPGVKVDYYEINTGSSDTLERVDASSSRMFYEVNTCVENKLERQLKAKVRAVNVLEDGRPLYGNWSDIATAPCDSAYSSASWRLPIIILSVVVMFVLLVYAGKIIYYKLRLMCNYPKVILPPELNNVIGKYDQGKEKLPDEMLPGEPLLPEKMIRPSNPSGDTSGCCSGAESVSSVESGGTLGTLSLDLGTSQTESPKLDLESTESKDVALRQRPNVKKGYVTMADLSEASWPTKPPQTGYSSVGMLPPPLELEYTPLTDLTSKSPYVPFAEAVSESVPVPSGYVPHLPQEPASKNTPYVLAGEPTPAPAKPTVGCKLTPMLPPYTLQQEESPTLFNWQPKLLKEPAPTAGYVMVGESKANPKSEIVMPTVNSKGYVPHVKLQENAKSFKED